MLKKLHTMSEDSAFKNVPIFLDQVHRSITKHLYKKSILTPENSLPGSENFVGNTTGASPTVTPAIPNKVQLGLTTTYITLYSGLFLIVYIQLWLILFYKHKRFSYQSIFLFLCLLWASLRTLLFSFYFQNCKDANNLPAVFDWFLYCFPTCLQFITLTLLVLFFSQVVFKAKAKYEPSKYKLTVQLTAIIANLIFLATNIVSEIFTYQNHYNLIPWIIIVVRVIINDTLFIIFGIFLSVCIYRMAKISSANLVLEAQGTSRCQAVITCVLIIILFSSRAIYNMIAVFLHRFDHFPSFGFDWLNVSDQADFRDLDDGYRFLTFGTVLFIWEFLPTFIVVIFFRVQKPNGDKSLTDISTRNQSSRAYFFDNPRRYDSDDDLTRSSAINSPRAGSMIDPATSPFSINDRQQNFGSVPRGGSAPRSLANLYGSSQVSGNTHYIPGTTPPMLFTSGQPNFLNQQNFYDGT